MEGRLGIIFVELDLDYSKFEKGQKTILDQATQTSQSVEKNWKILGEKSDVIYQAMAQGAIRAYNMISNRAATSAEEQFRAQSAMVAKINTLNQQMANNPLYATLGVRSVAAIEAQKAAIISSYETIKKSGSTTSQDLINIERAKNDKLKELDKEMVGSHEMSMASMMRAVLRFYAAWYVARMAAETIAAPFIKGFNAVETFNQSVASMAAMVVTFSERQKGMDLAGQWENALKYSTAMVPILENIAARTLLSGQETTALANAFARSGVFLDANNKSQIEAFTRISNALPLMTQYQEIMRQINTEIRAVMTGSNTASSMMLQTLKAIDPQIKEHLVTWRQEGTVLEHIGEMLIGFGPATKLLENQWQAVKTTLDTTVTQILRAGMKDTYAEIIKQVQDLNEYLKDNKKAIEQGINEALKITIKSVKDLIALYNFLPTGTVPLAGGIIGGILFGSTPMGLIVGGLISINEQLDKLTNFNLFKNVAFGGWIPDAVIGIQNLFNELKNGPAASAAAINALESPMEMLERLGKGAAITSGTPSPPPGIKPPPKAGLSGAGLINSSYFKKISEASGEFGLFMKDIQDFQNMNLFGTNKIEAPTVENMGNLDFQEPGKYLTLYGLQLDKTTDVYAANAAKQLDIRTKLEKNIAQLSMSGRDYKKYLLDEEIKDLELHAGDEKDIQDLIQKYKKLSLDESYQDYLKFLDGLEPITSDFFYNLFQGNVNSWDDMLKSMKNSFIRMLADMAARAIQEPIILPIVQSIIGGGVGSAAGVGGSSGIGSSLSLMNIGGTASSILNYKIPSLSFLGGSSANAAAGISGGNLTQAVNMPSSTAGGLTIGNALSYYGYGSLGYSTVGKWVGLPQSKYSGYGAGAGAAAGAEIGSVYPVIGTAIGAIIGAIVGGVGGSFFGKPDKTANYKAFSVPFGQYAVSTEAGKQPGWMDAFDEQVWKIVNADMESTYSAVDAFVASLPSGIGDGIKDAIHKTVISFPKGDIGRDSAQADITTWINSINAAIWDQIGSAFESGGFLSEDAFKAFITDLQNFGTESANIIAQGFRNTLMTNDFQSFKDGLKDAVFNSVSEGLITAMLQSDAFKEALAPLFYGVQSALNQSMVGGVFNADTFNQIATPYLNQVNAVIDSMQPVFDTISGAIQNIRANVYEGTGTPTGVNPKDIIGYTEPVTAPTVTVNINGLLTTGDAAANIAIVLQHIKDFNWSNLMH